jgi:hypothetical protein
VTERTQNKMHVLPSKIVRVVKLSGVQRRGWLVQSAAHPDEVAVLYRLLTDFH